MSLCICGEEKINNKKVKIKNKEVVAPLIPRRGKSLRERGAMNKIDKPLRNLKTRIFSAVKIIRGIREPPQSPEGGSFHFRYKNNHRVSFDFVSLWWRKIFKFVVSLINTIKVPLGDLGGFHLPNILSISPLSKFI